MGMNDLSPLDNLAAQNRHASDLRDIQDGDELTRKDSQANEYRKYGNGKAALKIRRLQSDIEVNSLSNLDVCGSDYYSALLDN